METEMKSASISIFFFAATGLAQVHAAEISANCEHPIAPCVSLKGEITSDDLIQLKAIFNSATRPRTFFPGLQPPVEIFELELNSLGGSLEAAMEIGRWVRKNGISTTMPQRASCFSACVYILAAGVRKRILGSQLDQKVGIHRPYLTQVPKSGVQVAMRRSLADSKLYFTEMNVLEQLADAMFSIPPDKVEILTDERLSYYRLEGLDMAYAEELELKSAALFGMTRHQYMLNSKLVSDETEKCLERSRRGEKFDGQKCISDAKKKYGLDPSKIQSRP